MVVASVATIAATVLAATGADAATAAVTAATPAASARLALAQPHARSGGTLTFALATSPDGLDPDHVPGAVDARVMAQMYANLVYETPKRTFVPWLATSWSSNADASVWTFDLRKGVTFQDGAPFDAAAVCFNLNRIVDPKEASEYAISLLGPFKSCAAPTPTKVVVTFSHGYAPFLEALSEPFLGMVSPKAVKAEGANFNLDPVGAGAGPFEFVKWIQNDEIVLKRWSGYQWAPKGSPHDGPAYLSTLVFKIVPAVATRIGSVQSGQFGGAETVLPSEFAALKANASLTTYDVLEAEAPYQLFFNLTKAPWSELKMREAVRAAIDVPQIVKSVYFGVETPATGPLTPNMPDFDAALAKAPAFDPAKADRLLSAAGWKMGKGGYRTKDGKVLTLNELGFSPDRTFRQEVDNFIQQELAKVGIKYAITDPTIVPAIHAIETNAYDISGLSLVNGSPNVLYSEFDSAFRPSATAFGFNLGRLDIPHVDALLGAAQETTSPSRQASLYHQVQAYVVDHALTVPIYNAHYTMVTTSKLKGVTFDLRGYPSFYGAYFG